MPRLRYRLALKKSLYLLISSSESGASLMVERANPKGLMLVSSFGSLMVVGWVEGKKGFKFG
jgi:hypothetical protein